MSDTRPFRSANEHQLRSDQWRYNHSYEAVLTLNSAYARIHGHGFAHFEWHIPPNSPPHTTAACHHQTEGGRAASWCKILAIAHAMTRGIQGRSCAHLLFLDSDAFIADVSLKLPEYVRRKLGERNDELIRATRPAAGKYWDLLLANDYPNALPLDGDGCAGVVFARSSARACSLLRGWWNAHYPSTNLAEPVEQPAINRLLHRVAASRNETVAHVLPTATYFAHAYARHPLFSWDGFIIHQKGSSSLLAEAVRSALQGGSAHLYRGHIGRSQQCRGVRVSEADGSGRVRTECKAQSKLALPSTPSGRCSELPSHVRADEREPAQDDACRRRVRKDGVELPVSRC